MTNNTRPVAISCGTACRSASGKASAMLDAMVFGFCELSSWNVIVRPPDSTIATAIVSPRARPRPSMAADTMPDRPNGITTWRIISHFVAPSAIEASSCRPGVRRKTSRDSAVMIGRIMIASTSAAVSMVRPVPETSPPNNGMNPR